MLITITNTKGGVGKSTLACHLAIWLFDLGHSVALLDTDPQCTAAEWIQNAEMKIAVRIATDTKSIKAAIKELSTTHEVIVADAPGEEGETENFVTMRSDFAILPLQPTKPDVRALKGALKSIRLAHAVTQGKKPETVLVLNCVRKRNRKTAILKEQLRSCGHRVANCDVRRLDALADSCDSAVTREDSLKAREAAVDIRTLFAELFSEMLPVERVGNG